MSVYSVARPIAAGISTVVLCFALAGVPVRGQDRPEERTVFRGEAQVLAIEVPVQVLAGGEPVRGLTAEDFRIYEGDELRTLTGFEVVDLAVTGSGSGATGDAAGAPAPPAAFAVPPAGRRHFLLFFDLSFTELGFLSRALSGARSLVREGLHPSDLVGVAFYTTRQGASLALQFTPDRAQVERMLDAFEVLIGEAERPDENAAAGAGDSGRPDPLGLTAGGYQAALAEVGQAAGYQTSDFAEALAEVQGRGSGVGGFLMRNILAHSAAFMEQAYEEQRATLAAYLADNLKALAEALRGIEGPKHLVLLSQGFDDRLLKIWVLRAIDEMVTELRRSGWVIHGADLGGIADGLDAEEAAHMKAGLFYLADQTGGTLVENTNDLALGLDDVLERTSVTYLLTFQTGEVVEDGAFHRIRVELVDGPRRARLVHRTGYHAPLPPGEGSPFVRRAQAAAQILAGVETGGLAATVRATALSYSGERARVPVVVEIAGGELLEPGAANDAPAELYLYAFEAGGAVADFVAQAVALPAPSREEGGEPRGVKLIAALDLPPGRYELRALVRGPGAGREALRTVTVEVPDLAGAPRLLPPVFVQAPAERWVVAELSEGEGSSYPFTVEGKRIAPAALPVLVHGQTVRLLLPGIALAGGDVRIDTRIVDDAGRPATAGRLEILGQRPSAAGQPDLLVARLDPAGLAPGSYTVELTLAGTGQQVRAPFRVEG